MKSSKRFTIICNIHQAFPFHLSWIGAQNITIIFPMDFFYDTTTLIQIWKLS